MSPRPGQDPNDPKFQESLRRWQEQNNLPSTAERKGGSSRQYGAYMNLPPGSRVTRDFVDRDGDRIDDRYQSGPGQPRGGSAAPRSAENNTVPANVQAAWNTYNNPPPRTGGLKPTKEMAAQFEQYGLTNQSANTRIGGTLPDGSVKGDRNQDGRFGIQDFILRKKPALPSSGSNATPSSADIIAGRSDLYGFKNPRKPKRPSISSADLQKANDKSPVPPRSNTKPLAETSFTIPLAGTWNPNMPKAGPAR